jgi:chromosomal replication initiation ATPase DnaA
MDISRRMTGRTTQSLAKLTAQSPVLEWRVDVLETLVAATFAVPVNELRAGTRRRKPVAFARQSAMYLAHIVLGLSYAEVGRIFGRDRTTAAHACRVIEERRDDPLLDLVLSALEHTYDAAPQKAQVGRVLS